MLHWLGRLGAAALGLGLLGATAIGAGARGLDLGASAVVAPHITGLAASGVASPLQAPPSATDPCASQNQQDTNDTNAEAPETTGAETEKPEATSSQENSAADGDNVQCGGQNGPNDQSGDTGTGSATGSGTTASATGSGGVQLLSTAGTTLSVVQPTTGQSQTTGGTDPRAETGTAEQPEQADSAGTGGEQDNIDCVQQGQQQGDNAGC